MLGNGATKDDPTEKVVYVLTSNSFQKWLLTQGDPDRMFYNCDLENIAKEAFATHIWVSNIFLQLSLSFRKKNLMKSNIFLKQFYFITCNI